MTLARQYEQILQSQRLHWIAKLGSIGLQKLGGSIGLQNWSSIAPRFLPHFRALKLALDFVCALTVNSIAYVVKVFATR